MKIFNKIGRTQTKVGKYQVLCVHVQLLVKIPPRLLSLHKKVSNKQICNITQLTSIYLLNLPTQLTSKTYLAVLTDPWCLFNLFCCLPLVIEISTSWVVPATTVLSATPNHIMSLCSNKLLPTFGTSIQCTFIVKVAFISFAICFAQIIQDHFI